MASTSLTPGAIAGVGVGARAAEDEVAGDTPSREQLQATALGTMLRYAELASAAIDKVSGRSLRPPPWRHSLLPTQEFPDDFTEMATESDGGSDAAGSSTVLAAGGEATAGPGSVGVGDGSTAAQPMLVDDGDDGGSAQQQAAAVGLPPLPAGNPQTPSALGQNLPPLPGA